VLWTYFTDSTMTAMSSIVDRQDLIRKVYFPRLVILIGASVSSLLTLLINLVIILAFLLIAGIHPTLMWLLFPVLAVELYVFSLGCSLLLACLYVKFRDFRHIWEVILQIGFYATPIIYPLSLVPKRYLPVFLINPLAQIIQDARYVLVTHTAVLDGSTVSWPFKLIPYLIPIVIFVIGFRYFTANAAKFAEEV
jgi:ABC-2 type transport system permease protein